MQDARKSRLAKDLASLERVRFLATEGPSPRVYSLTMNTICPPCGRVSRIAIAMIAAAALTGLAPQSKSEPQAPANSPAHSPSNTQPSTRAFGAPALEEFRGYKAVTRPSKDAVMGFTEPTNIKELLVRGGEDVKTGQLMVRGDDAEELTLLKLQREVVAKPLQVEASKAERDLAKVQYDRIVEVQQRGGSGTLEVEQARLNAEIKRISHELAISQQTQQTIQIERVQARVDRFRLSAPFDGIVDVVSVDVGQSVSVQDKVIRVVSVDPLWIDVPAPMQDAKTLSLSLGDPAWLMCDVAGEARVFRGKIIEVAPTSDPASRTRRVRVELPNPKGPARLIAGEPIWARFTEPTGFAVMPSQADQAVTQK
jgi:RND family efflux transporter MFP subunit